MREIFFARDKFSLFGEGHFTGTFHMFKGGRELKGDFTSALAGVNDYRFPEPRGLAGLGARSHGGDARHLGLQRRQDRFPLPDGAARQTRSSRPGRNFDVEYADVDLCRVDRVLPDARAAAGRPRVGPQHDGVAARQVCRALRFGHRDVRRRPAVPACRGRSLPRMRPRRRRGRYLVQGPFSQHTPLEPIPVSGDVTYAFDPEAMFFEPSRIFTPDTYIAFEGRDRLRRAVEDSVPRHQPQLAGERSLPGRHHDGVRRADAGDPDRRRRPLRRRDARCVPAAAHRRPLHRLRDARLGRQLGRGRRRLRRRELLRERQPRGDRDRACRGWT